MTIHRSVGEHVEVIGIGNGTVIKIHEDSFRRPIYTLKMDNPSDTADGLFYARAEELRYIERETKRSDQ